MPQGGIFLDRMCRIRAVLARPEGDIDLNLIIELAEDRNHPVEGKPAQLGVADTGEFRVRNAGQAFGVAG